GDALTDLKLHVEGSSHFDRGPTTFAVALGKMGVTDREQSTFFGDRNCQPDPFGQLFDVDVACGLSGWNRAQRSGGDGGVRRYCAAGAGWQCEAAPSDKRLFAVGDARQQMV